MQQNPFEQPVKHNPHELNCRFLCLKHLPVEACETRRLKKTGVAERQTRHACCLPPNRRVFVTRNHPSTEDTLASFCIVSVDKVNAVETEKRVQTRLSSRNSGRIRRRPSGLVEGLQQRCQA